MEVKGDISNRTLGLRLAETSVAGPEPIDLPNKIMSLSLSP